MRVIVRDREAEDKEWGTPGEFKPVTRVIIISDNCLVCGKERGIPKLGTYTEDGTVYSVHTWINPCGHVDHYEGVLREAGVY